MSVAELRQSLDDFHAATPLLRSLGLAELRRGHANLVQMAASGMPLDLLAEICQQFAAYAPGCADPDMALNNLGRFVAAARNPLSMGTLFQRDPTALPTLLQIFSTSQHFSDLLVADPESFDLLRLTEGQPSSRQALVEEILSEVSALEHEALVLRALRRFKHREMLRIAYGDIVREQGLQTVTTQLSYLADAILEAALAAAWKKTQKQWGTPRRADGSPARFVVLGMGKLGGVELNYSSDIDLIFLYDEPGQTDGKRRTTNAEFFERLAREFVGYLTVRTELGAAYRVDLRLRPEGQRGPIVHSAAAALAYYDTRGRTWERQAYIKARPVAGDHALGAELLERLTGWIYRRYLSRADISGIKALKRRIEQQARHEGGEERDVKTGRGGIRDIEFVIQFLQLLSGADLPAVRTGNTLEAIVQLEKAGCLRSQERMILEENYCFLRKIEHRLQIMFDLQTHRLPAQSEELRKLALRLGYADMPAQTALASFEADYRRRSDLNRRILDHLLHDAFGDEPDTEAEVDLVLDPDPPEQRVREVLGRYRFRDARQAYRTLMSLAEEKIRFLSTRRCRHFLASIAPKLLRAIAATPDPDATLVNLGKVSDSLGGKGVLWELFSFNPPSLRLYVELCAYGAHLCEILTSNPGMIDSLMDSLVLDKLPGREALQETLEQLCRAAEDLDPILHSFKNDQQLCVGVRDLLGKEEIPAVTGALSDIAETCLVEIARREYARLVEKFGTPTLAEGPHAGEPCGLVILALGKFGGREMNYQSDLDIVFLYEGEGHTAPERASSPATTSNQHFFSELGQRIIKTASRLGPFGRLYQIDARLRPTGKSGSLATSLDELARYFASGAGQLWERQALCKARVVYAPTRAAKAATAAVARAAFEHPWQRSDAEQVRQMRHRLEETASGMSLKRRPGGLVDIEFLVQMLQLKHGRRNPRLRTPSTLAALEALGQAGILAAEDCQFLARTYRFLRTVESRLQLMNSTARDKLPEDPTELAKLAHLLRASSGDAVLAEFDRCTRETRARFDRIFDAEKRG
ncbi:MAG: bifunctional [glutamate--ammonia ligase]-adenylyl-L-tyrosine phosphorylase/[glutamate--ammonia-ligase] adenylyltransferase [Thermoguttaceae bacterium]